MIIKNSNIRRNIFENRYVIFAIIIAIILALSIIRLLNENAKEKFREKENQIQNTTISLPKEERLNKPVISGESIDKKEQDNNTKIIEEFISFCNQKEIQKAYDLLTKTCKEEKFKSNIQLFKTNYVDKIFVNKKTCTIENWINSYKNTYKIKIIDDMLSSGKVSSLENTIEDYYTIERVGNETKLNIDGYIGRQEVNKEVNNNGITVRILERNIYKEYESYDIAIENLTANTILLNSRTESRLHLFG